MNFLMLLTSLLIGATYNAEDLHYYDTNLQSRGLPLVNKVFVDISGKDKKAFFELVDKAKNIERFKEFNNGEISGVLLFTDSRAGTLDVLNTLTSNGFNAYPVIIFDNIECTSSGEIAVQVKPSVNQEDFTKRLHSIADGKFKVSQISQKMFSVRVESLNNPSNILILANLLAKDTAWNVYAMVNWVPLDGYVKANVSVESGAVSQLGEMRNFKVTLDVFDRDVKIRTDMLPQLGQGLLPFPYAGEIWFDPSPPHITETNTNRGKTVTINYPFRQLQYGSFVFQPIIISYERKGELKTVKTNNCQYNVRSVIMGTDIDDIQPRTNDGLDLMLLNPVGIPKMDDPMKSAYFYAKIAVSSLCFGIAAFFLIGAAFALKNGVSGWMNEDEEGKLWSALKSLKAPSEQMYPAPYYGTVSKYVNKILNEAGTSLYSVNLAECTANFRNLVGELDKLYQQNPFWNVESLKDFVKQVCKDRRFK